MNTFHQFELFMIDLAPEAEIKISSTTDVDAKFAKHSTGAMINPLFEIDMSVEQEKITYAFDPIKFRETCVQLLSLIVDSARSIPIIEPKVLPCTLR